MTMAFNVDIPPQKQSEDHPARPYIKWVGICVVLTPVALFLAFLSTGAGHGNYFFCHLLFPYATMIWQVLLKISYESIESFIPLILMLAIIQFPLYGIFFAINERNENNRIIALLAILHFVIFALSFLIFLATQG